MTDSVAGTVLSTDVRTQRNITSNFLLLLALVLISGVQLRNPRQLPGATLKPDPILGRSPARVGGFGVLVLLIVLLFPARALADSPVDGWASEYGPGNGVATQWCTWALRHSQGCGLLRIESLDTGLVVYAPVIDWCQCYRGTPQERIVDLEYGVVAALGLDRSQGLYRVSTQRVGGFTVPDTAFR